MIDLSFLKGVPIGVMGLARSGLAAAQALQAGGAEVWAWDDKEGGRAAVRGIGLEPVDLRAADLGRLKSLVLSPGIPHTHPSPHPVAARAREAGVEIVGDIELLVRAQPSSRMVGVTGTNGKSTTTALIGHILAAAGRPAAVGGNLGMPVLAFDPPGEDGVYVLEMSSYQLELTPSVVFEVAVLLNISPDHLDRHGGMDGYVSAKRRVFQGRRAGQTAVIGIDDEWCRAIHAELASEDCRTVVPISVSREALGGVYVRDGGLVDATGASPLRIMEMNEARSLPGRHNWQNAAAAYAATAALGLEPMVIADAIRSFPGLPHRQQLVAEAAGVRFINDSKATNADAAARALSCYDAIYWIAGGKPKEGGLNGLEDFMPRIRHAFLIGEAADEFAEWLNGRAHYTKSGDLATALDAANDLARAEGQPGAVILLSPACASFDQFANFEERGLAFTRLAAELAADGVGGKA